MAQAESLSHSVKGKEEYIPDEIRGKQKQRHGSESWLIEVKRRCKEYKIRPVSPKVSIYRVPKVLMDAKMQAYVPTVVSLGPYHHKIDPNFSAMDEHKFEAVQRTLERLRGVALDDLVAHIKTLEREIRYCYEDSASEWNAEMLSWMFVMDACFVLEYIRSQVEEDTYPFSLIFTSAESTMNQTILHDIIKLENQIPLFVLIGLLQFEFRGELAISELAKILSKYYLFRGFPFSSEMPSDVRVSRITKHIDKGACHLLDLCRRIVKEILTQSNNESSNAGETDGSSWIRRPQWMNVPAWLRRRATADGTCFTRPQWMNLRIQLPRPCWRNMADSTCFRRPQWLQRRRQTNLVDGILSSTSTPNDERSFTPTAEQLHKVGVQFKLGHARFYRSRFGRSTLFLPEMCITDHTDMFFRNLMTFEESQRRSRISEATVISHYIRLMEDLIDSERDVSILKKAKIIKSYMGSDEEIATIFNHLGKGITFEEHDRFQFEIAANQAREHYNSLLKVWINQFRIEYLSKPWYIFPVVAAILILVMTAVQTVYSVLKS